jgi:hypothetical protein
MFRSESERKEKQRDTDKISALGFFQEQRVIDKLVHKNRNKMLF